MSNTICIHRVSNVMMGKTVSVTSISTVRCFFVDSTKRRFLMCQLVGLIAKYIFEEAILEKQ